jgi:hypothetical protein
MDDSQTLTFREPWLLKKFYFYFSNLADQICSKLMEHWDWRKETKLKRNRQTRFLWRKGRPVNDFCNFFVRKAFFCVWELQNRLAQALFNLWIWGAIDSLHYDVIILKVGVMHMLMKTQCTCSCGMVFMMHVIMTRLATKWVSDCEGNLRLRRSMCGKSHPHSQDT